MFFPPERVKSFQIIIDEIEINNGRKERHDESYGSKVKDSEAPCNYQQNYIESNPFLIHTTTLQLISTSFR